MINQLHARLRRPERGWDPVPQANGATYGAAEWKHIDLALLDTLEARIGGFAGKRILDLGAGPGQYTVSMAQRGGLLTWHDISAQYRTMAQRKAQEHGVADRVEFSLGYLDEAPRLLARQFDLVFNRICWYYGMGDASFSRCVYQLVRPGGHAYVDTTNSQFKRGELSANARLRTRLNEWTGLKIGHPFPPHGRLARLFLQQPVRSLTVDYSAPLNDRVFFQKAG